MEILAFLPAEGLSWYHVRRVKCARIPERIIYRVFRVPYLVRRRSALKCTRLETSTLAAETRLFGLTGTVEVKLEVQ